MSLRHITPLKPAAKKGHREQEAPAKKQAPAKKSQRQPSHRRPIGG
ncbi:MULTISPECIES: hypothetical protein [unclassified Streptomyces]|nr:hypothetical protein [Streptomyces sp. NBC_01429]